MLLLRDQMPMPLELKQEENELKLESVKTSPQLPVLTLKETTIPLALKNSGLQWKLIKETTKLLLKDQREITKRDQLLLRSSTTATVMTINLPVKKLMPASETSLLNVLNNQMPMPLELLKSSPMLSNKLKKTSPELLEKMVPLTSKNSKLNSKEGKLVLPLLNKTDPTIPDQLNKRIESSHLLKRSSTTAKEVTMTMISLPSEKPSPALDNILQAKLPRESREDKTELRKRSERTGHKMPPVTMLPLTLPLSKTSTTNTSKKLRLELRREVTEEPREELRDKSD